MIQHLALDALQRHLAGSPLYGWATSLPAQIAARIEEGHGDLARWWSAVQRLPQVPAPKVELAQRFALHSDHDAALQAQVKEALQGLIPGARAVRLLRRTGRYRMAFRLEMGACLATCRTAWQTRPRRRLRQRLLPVAHARRRRGKRGRGRSELAVPLPVPSRQALPAGAAGLAPAAGPGRPAGEARRLRHGILHGRALSPSLAHRPPAGAQATA